MKSAKYLMIVVVMLTLGFPIHAAAAEEIVFLVSPTPSVDILIKKIPEFTKATGIDVRVESIAYETMMEKEILDLKTKQGTYDVYWIEAPFLERYYKLGGLADINALAKELNMDLSDFPQGLVDSFSYDGALRALPFESNPMVMIYRTDLLKIAELKVPTTMDEYMEVVKALNKEGVNGTSLMGARHEALFYEYINFLWAFGGKLFNDDMTPALNSAEAAKALEFMISLKDYAPAGTLSYTWTESATAFQQGDVGIEIIFPDWTAAMIDPKESKVVGKWAYAPIPGTGHVASGGYAWAVNGYSKKQKEAMQFAYWATSKEVQMDLAPAGATLSRASVMTDPGLNAKYPHLSVLGKSAKRAQPPMKIAPYSELLDVVTQGLSEALSGGKPAGDALKKINSQWAEILKDNGYIK